MRAYSRLEPGRVTRERLLAAATKCLPDGEHDRSFEAIATDAGVTRGALYHYFSSEEGLVEEVYKQAVRRHPEHVVCAAQDGAGRELLLALIQETARLYGSATPFYRLLVRAAGTPRSTARDGGAPTAGTEDFAWLMERPLPTTKAYRAEGGPRRSLTSRSTQT